jgi:hypothetical protein
MSDNIKIKRSPSGRFFILDIYFHKINSTISIELPQKETLEFLATMMKVVIDEEKVDLLSVSLLEDDISGLYFQLHKLRQRFKEIYDVAASAVESYLIVYIKDRQHSLITGEQLVNAGGDLMESLGFTIAGRGEPVYGSFFQKVKYVFSGTIGTEDLEKLYFKGKKALELKYVDLPTAEQTEKLANAADKLVSTLQNVEEGVVRCGALIVLKGHFNGKPRLIIQQLSTEMILILERSPNIIYNLNTVYELITGDARDPFNN